LKNDAGTLFNPRFGLRPDLFLGRSEAVETILSAQDSTNSPYRTTFITGLRGSGKTSLLSDIAIEFQKKKELVVSVSEMDDLLAAVIDQLLQKSRNIGRKITGISASALGFSFGVSLSSDAQSQSFRGAIGKILMALKNQGISPIILIDEVSGETKALKEFASTYQLMAREGLDMLVVAAGLPKAVSRVANERALTFLQKAGRIKLGPLPMDEILDTYLKVFSKSDPGVTYELVKMLAGQTYGFPYLYQLIGYYVTELSGGKIDGDVAAKALARSKELLFENVLSLLLRDTTEKERDFLFAMLRVSNENATGAIPGRLDGTTVPEVRFGDIANRMGVTKSYAVKYRQRLLDAMLIEKAGYGKLRFAPPLFSEYLSLEMDNY
jgi:energy-coupling factor transporter ATP-binding protein EcfA2